MAETTLLTRDGKPVRDIGSWEKEQAAMNPIREITVKQRKNTKDKTLAYMYRMANSKNKQSAWVVKMNINDVYYGSTSFTDSKFGGEAEAKKAAMKFRDEKVAELQRQGIIPVDRRVKTNKGESHAD